MKNPKKILLIRFGAIGDLVVCSPVIRCIKVQYPNCEIHFLTKNIYRSLLDYNPNLSRVHGIENHINECISTLKKEKFDTIIDLHNNLRTLHLQWKLKRKFHSFSKEKIKRWRIIKLQSDDRMQHRVNAYFKALQFLHVNYDGKGLSLFIPKEEQFDRAKLPFTHSMGYFAFVIGSLKKTKRPPESLIEKIIVAVDAPIILIGGPDEKEMGERIAKKYPFQVINACGKHSLLQSASIIEQSKVVIAPDTGMMHVAAAFKKKLIVIWGSTNEQLGMYPWMAEVDKVKYAKVEGLKCQPCHKHGYDSCPKKHFDCMEKQDPQEIKNYITQFQQQI